MAGMELPFASDTMDFSFQFDSGQDSEEYPVVETMSRRGKHKVYIYRLPRDPELCYEFHVKRRCADGSKACVCASCHNLKTKLKRIGRDAEADAFALPTIRMRDLNFFSDPESISHICEVKNTKKCLIRRQALLFPTRRQITRAKRHAEKVLAKRNLEIARTTAAKMESENAAISLSEDTKPSTSSSFVAPDWTNCTEFSYEPAKCLRTEFTPNGTVSMVNATYSSNSMSSTSFSEFEERLKMAKACGEKYPAVELIGHNSKNEICVYRLTKNPLQCYEFRIKRRYPDLSKCYFCNSCHQLRMKLGTVNFEVPTIIVKNGGFMIDPESQTHICSPTFLAKTLMHKKILACVYHQIMFAKQNDVNSSMNHSESERSGQQAPQASNSAHPAPIDSRNSAIDREPENNRCTTPPAQSSESSVVDFAFRAISASAGLNEQGACTSSPVGPTHPREKNSLCSPSPSPFPNELLGGSLFLDEEDPIQGIDAASLLSSCSSEESNAEYVSSNPNETASSNILGDTKPKSTTIEAAGPSNTTNQHGGTHEASLSSKQLIQEELVDRGMGDYPATEVLSQKRKHDLYLYRFPRDHSLCYEYQLKRKLTNGIEAYACASCQQIKRRGSSFPVPTIRLKNSFFLSDPEQSDHVCVPKSTAKCLLARATLSVTSRLRETDDVTPPSVLQKQVLMTLQEDELFKELSQEDQNAAISEFINGRCGSSSANFARSVQRNRMRNRLDAAIKRERILKKRCLEREREKLEASKAGRNFPCSVFLEEAFVGPYFINGVVKSEDMENTGCNLATAVENKKPTTAEVPEDVNILASISRDFLSSPNRRQKSRIHQ